MTTHHHRHSRSLHRAGLLPKHMTGAVAVLLCCVSVALSTPVFAQQAGPGNDVPSHTDFVVTADAALHATLPAAVQKAGYINIGTNPNTPPTTFYGKDNLTLEGREVDIMSAIAHRLGLQPHWRDTGGFDNIIPGLSSGRYDAALANLDATAERLKRIDFVAYFSSNRLALVTQGTPQNKNTPALTDLAALCGQTIGAGSGTSNVVALEQQSQRCVAAGKAAITVPLFPSRPAGVQAVLSGRTPAFFGPYEGLKYMASVSHDTLHLAGVFQVPGSPVSIGLAKDSPLTEPVRAALASLIKDGTYAKILAKWDMGYGEVHDARSNQTILAGDPK